MNTSEIQSIALRTAEDLRSRFFGKYRGTVAELESDGSLCRLRAYVPDIYGARDGASVKSPWALPALPFAGPSHGLILMPEVNDGVWIEFEAGDISRPIWTGCWFADGDRPDPSTAKARVLATSAGHKLVLDDDAQKVQLLHSGGAEFTMEQSQITLKLGSCQIVISQNDININNGMVKITTSGASLVNDALKVGT
jgi:Type VI secretion system/phage-baseplate injector OB domain